VTRAASGKYEIQCDDAESPEWFSDLDVAAHVSEESHLPVVADHQDVCQVSFFVDLFSVFSKKKMFYQGSFSFASSSSWRCFARASFSHQSTSPLLCRRARSGSFFSSTLFFFFFFFFFS
jgi:hypothetical protein